MAFDPRLRSEKEVPLFILGIIFSSLSWLLLIVSIIGLIYGSMVLVFVLIAHALHLAHVQGNGLKISERQLPDLYERVKVAAEKLGLAHVPDIYVLQSGGILNAFATKLLSRRFVIIYSELADNCADSRQLDFVVGHELGHLAAGHLTWMFFLLPFRLVPWLGPAYSRACEYTCDRAGLAVVGGLEPSLRGLCVLAAGRLAGRADLQAFSDQRSTSGGFWMSIFELVSTHPFLCKRAAALQEFAAPGTVKPVPRNVLAYPLAPFLGFTAAGNMQVGFLVVIFFLAYAFAMAVPAFKQYRNIARGGAAASQLRSVEADEIDDQLDNPGVHRRDDRQRAGSPGKAQQRLDSPAKSPPSPPEATDRVH
jgi:Zn-dependent protease with chaperone function